MNVRNLQQIAHRIDGIHLPMNDVVIPHHVLHALVGGFPRHDKYRQALLDCPANEAFFGAEVENIIAIYPRRKDDDWRFQHVLRSEKHTSALRTLMRITYAHFSL